MIVFNPINILCVLVWMLAWASSVRAEVVRTVQFGPGGDGKGAPLACAASRDGKRMAVGLGSHAAVVLDIKDNEQNPVTLNGHEGAVTAVAFSPGGDRLLTGSEDATARIWEIGTAKASVLQGHGGPVRAVAFSSDGRQALTASDDSTARIWNAETGKLVRQLNGHRGAVRAAVFSSDGQTAITGSDDKTVRVWDARTGKLIRAIGVGEKVLALAISPDGRQAAIGMNKDQAEVWDLSKGRLVKTLWGHAGAVRSVAYIPGGRKIVTGSPDCSFIYWDAATARELYRGVQDGPVGQVACVPGTPYVLTLNEKQASVGVLDVSSDLPRPIRTRAEKVLLLAGFCVGLVVGPMAIILTMVLVARINRRNKKSGRVADRGLKIALQVSAVAMALFMAFAFLEMGLRGVLEINYKGGLERLPPPPPADSHREIEFLEIVDLDPDPKIGYTFRPDIKAWFGGCRITNNSMGYRDDPVTMPKPARTIRVVGVGDSTMWGYGIRKEENYLEILEAEFNDLLRPDWRVEFVNTGVVGYNTTQESAAFVKRGIKLDPDAVIAQFDKNDLQSIVTTPKPDFLFARILMLAHLPEIFRGDASDPRAFYMLYQKDLLANPAYPYTGWSAVEQGYREIARACRERNIPVYGLLVCEDTPGPNDPMNPAHARVLDLWARIGITPIQTLPGAQKYLRENGGNWLKITNRPGDTHPNAIGHGLIAQAVLPYMLDFLLKKTGVAVPAGHKARLGNLILRQMTESGLHQNEKWGDAMANWTGPCASFEFIRAGDKVIVPLEVRHPDISETNPVKVRVTIEGSPKREVERTITRKGPASIAVDLHDLHAGPLKMTITVSRTFTTPTDSRNMGVAVHNLRFE